MNELKQKVEDSIKRERKGKKPFVAGNTPEDVYRWWMEYDTLPGQIDLLEDYNET